MLIKDSVENASKLLVPYENIFDIVRTVDPIRKKVIWSNNYKTASDISYCCSLWEGNTECKDCISIKALNDQKTHIKIQHIADKMFLVFAAPVKVNGETLVMELIKDISDDLVFETVVQGQGHILQNIVEDLNTIILKDTLTNLYNRRYIHEMLPKEIMGCNNRRPLSIAIIDIDYFKNINDTYGHNAGDIVIKKFAQTLSHSIRTDVDWAARYGGEEFLVCLPNTDCKRAYKVFERIRKAIERASIKAENNKIQTTGSFGLCTIKNSELTAEDLIKLADEKLYLAKSQGRNRVVY